MQEYTISQLLKFKTFDRITTKTKFYKIHYPLLKNECKIEPITNKINEALYIAKNDINKEVLCDCGKRTNFISITNGYSKFCSVKCQRDNINSHKKIGYVNKSKDEIKIIIKNIVPDNYHRNNNEVMAFYGNIPKITNNVSKNIYLFMNNMIEEPKCLCDKPRKYLSYGQGYRSTCSSQKCRVQNYRNIQEEAGKWVKKEDLDDYILYARQVAKVTESQELSILENFDKRGRGYGYYNVDHKYSKIQGFKNNIPPFIIGNLINLEMLPHEENSSKNHKCSISKSELFRSFYA